MYNALIINVFPFNFDTFITVKFRVKGDPFNPSPLNYRFKLTNSCNISSEVVMIFVFAWKPRCAMIISVNSSERSTFDISREPDANRSAILSPAILILGVPELMDSWKSCLPTFVKPDVLLNLAIAI